MCIKKGEQLTSDEGHLFRQVLPKWFSDDGVPTTQAFWPWRKVDECCLSVDRSTITTAHKAFTLFTEPAPNGFNVPSGGVWSMMMSDVPEAQISLWEDALQAAEGGHRHVGDVIEGGFFFLGGAFGAERLVDVFTEEARLDGGRLARA